MTRRFQGGGSRFICIPDFSALAARPERYACSENSHGKAKCPGHEYRLLCFVILAIPTVDAIAIGTSISDGPIQDEQARDIHKPKDCNAGREYTVTHGSVLLLPN